MKKLTAVVLVIMLTVCCASVFAEGTRMTREDAMKIAVEHTGLKQEQVTFIKVQQDWDDGRQVFEIEFLCDGAKYEVEVDILTGRVTEYNVERQGRFGWDDDWDDDRDNDWDDWFDFD